MHIFIYVDNSDPQELAKVATPIATAIEEWLPTQAEKITLINQSDTTETGRSDRDIGVQLEINKPKQLLECVNLLQRLAKEHKQEWVLGILADGNYEDICYFGHTEGRPDIFEIASYVGLK